MARIGHAAGCGRAALGRGGWRAVAAVLLAAALAACGGGGKGGGSASKGIPLGSLRLSHVGLSSTLPYAGEPVTLAFEFVETAAAPPASRQIGLNLQSADQNVRTGSLALDGIGAGQPQPIPIVLQTAQFMRTTTTFPADSENLSGSVEGQFRIAPTLPDGTYDLVATAGDASAVLVRGVRVTRPDKPDFLVAPSTASVADATLGLPQRPETVFSPRIRPPHLYVNIVAANTAAPYAGPIEVALTLEVEGREHPLGVLQRDSPGVPRVGDTAMIYSLPPAGTKGVILSLYLPPEAYDALAAVTKEQAVIVNVRLDPNDVVPEMHESNNSAAPGVEYFPPSAGSAATAAAAEEASGYSAQTAATPTPNPCVAGFQSGNNCYLYSALNAFPDDSNSFSRAGHGVWEWGINPQLVYGVGIGLDLRNSGVASSTYYPLIQTKDNYTIPFGLASQNQATVGLYGYWGGLPAYSLSNPNGIVEEVFSGQASFVLLSGNGGALPDIPTPTPEPLFPLDTATPGGVPTPTPEQTYCDFTDASATDTNRYCFQFSVVGDDIFPPVTGPIDQDEIDLNFNQELALLMSFHPVDVPLFWGISLQVKLGFDGEFGDQGQIQASVSSDEFETTISNLGPFASLAATVKVYLSLVGLSVGIEGTSTLIGISSPLSFEVQAFKPAQWATVGAELPLVLTVLDPSDIILYVGLFGTPLEDVPLVDWNGFSWAFNLFPPFSVFLGNTLNTYDTMTGNASIDFVTLGELGNVDNASNCADFHWDSAHNRICGTGCSNGSGSTPIADQQVCLQFADASDVPQFNTGGGYVQYDSSLADCAGGWWGSCFQGFGGTCSGGENLSNVWCITNDGTSTFGFPANADCHDPQNCLQNSEQPYGGSGNCYDCDCHGGCSCCPTPQQPDVLNSSGYQTLPPGNWASNCIAATPAGGTDIETSFAPCWGGTGIGDGTNCWKVDIGTLNATCNPSGSSIVTQYSVTCSSTPFVNPAGGDYYQAPSYDFVTSGSNGDSSYLECGNYEIGFCGGVLWPTASACPTALGGSVSAYCPDILMLRDPNPNCGDNCRDTLCTSCYSGAVGPGEPTKDQCITYPRDTSESIGVCGGQLEPEACGCGGGSPGPTPACLAQYDMELLDPTSVDGYYTQVVDYNGPGPSNLPNPQKLNNDNTVPPDNTDSFPREIFWLDAGDSTAAPSAQGVTWGAGQAGWQGEFSFDPGEYDFHLLNARVTVVPLGSNSSCPQGVPTPAAGKSNDEACAEGDVCVLSSPRCQSTETVKAQAFKVPRPASGSTGQSVDYCVTVQPLACPNNLTTASDTHAYWVPSGGWTGLFFSAAQGATTACSAVSSALQDAVPICARSYQTDDLSVAIDDRNVPCRSMGDVDTNSFYAFFSRTLPYQPGAGYLASVEAIEPNASGVETGGTLCVCNGEGTCNEAEPASGAVGRQVVQVPQDSSCTAAAGCQAAVEYLFQPNSQAQDNYAVIVADVAPSSGFLVDYDVYLDPNSDTVSRFQGLVNTPYLDIWSPVGLPAADADTVMNAGAMCIKSARARGFMPIGSAGNAYENIILGAANMHARAKIDGQPAGDVFPLAPTPGEGNPPPDAVFYPGTPVSACDGAPSPACSPDPAVTPTPTPGPETPTAAPPCVPLTTVTPATPIPFPNIPEMNAYYTREYLVQVPVQPVAIQPTPPAPTPGVANFVKVDWDDWGTCLDANRRPVSARKPMRFRVPEQAENNVVALYFKSNDDLDAHMGAAVVGCCESGGSCMADVLATDCPTSTGAVFVADGSCTAAGTCEENPGNPAPPVLYSSLNLNPDGITSPIATNNGFAPFASYAVCECMRQNAALFDPRQEQWTCEGSFGGPQCAGWQAGSALDCQAPALVQGAGISLANADEQLPSLFLSGVSSGPVTAAVDKVIYDYNDPSGAVAVFNNIYAMISTRLQSTPANNPTAGATPTGTIKPGPPTPPVPGTGPNTVDLEIALRRNGSGGETPDGYQALLSTKQGAEGALIGPSTFAFVVVNSAGQPAGSVEPAAYQNWSATSTASQIGVDVTIGKDLLQAAEPFGSTPCQFYVVTNLAVGPDIPFAPSFSNASTASSGACLDAVITMTSAVSPSVSGSIQFQACVNGSCQVSAAASNQVVIDGASTYDATNSLLLRVFNQASSGQFADECFTADEQADIASKSQALTFTVALTPGDQSACYPTPGPGVTPTPTPPSCCNCAGQCTSTTDVCGSYKPVSCGSCQNFCQANFGAGCYATGYHVGANACGSDNSCGTGTFTSCPTPAPYCCRCTGSDDATCEGLAQCSVVSDSSACDSACAALAQPCSQNTSLAHGSGLVCSSADACVSP